MNTFKSAIDDQSARTLNGMKARKSTANSNVDLFFKIGAMRGQNIIPSFLAAFLENPDYALRITQWARDIRGGAGERQTFKNILLYLATTDVDACMALMFKIPEIGRWDDLLIKEFPEEVKTFAFTMIRNALEMDNGLCAKWMPRKGPIAIELRKFLNLSPKIYRKLLVNLSSTVEQQMCAKEWKEIDFSKVPSVAHARLKTAFYRNDELRYTKYVEKVTSGDKSVKVNAGAIFPHDVLNGCFRSQWGTSDPFSKTEQDLIIAQWAALENFVGDASIFPMVDVSGSMFTLVSGNSELTCMQVAISLGLYLADKNEGDFSDCFLTFSGNPEVVNLKGNILQKINQMETSRWAMNTDLVKAFSKLLDIGIEGKVSQAEMPKVLLILSDMQFDRCVRTDNTAMEMIREQYTNAGYEVPRVVFWNLNSYDNVPVKYNEKGAALVSGFSPAILKSILSANLEDFTPESIMLKTIMDERYRI